MRTQDQIVAHIRANPDDIHGNGVLFSFLELEHQRKIMGRYIVKGIKKEPEETMTIPDLGEMLIRTCAHARENLFEATGPAVNTRVQEIRKERLRALVWLLDDQAEIDWNMPIAQVVELIESRYGIVKA